MTKYLNCAETAALVRAALKESFSDVKFSVRSHVYSGGASINVSWTDGPNTKQVEAVAGVFSGSYFDGMTDFKGSTFAMISGEVVRFGADFIFCNRNFSDSFIERCISAVFSKYAGNLRGVTRPSVQDFRTGQLGYQQIDGLGNWTLRDMIYQQFAKRSDRIQGEKSKTAAQVIYLGNDGYSDVGALDMGDAA